MRHNPIVAPVEPPFIFCRSQQAESRKNHILVVLESKRHLLRTAGLRPAERVDTLVETLQPPACEKQNEILRSHEPVVGGGLAPIRPLQLVPPNPQ